LGIVIGVAAVIAMVAVGSGAQARVAEQIQSLGSNLIIVLPGSVISSGARLGHGTRWTITEDDALAIQRELDTVEVAAASRRGTFRIVYGALNWATQVQGVTAEYLEARDWPLVAGPADRSRRRSERGEGRAALPNYHRERVPVTDPLGEIIRIRNIPFTVIGVLAPKGQSSWGQDQDDLVLIPLSTANRSVFGVSKSSPRGVNAIAIKIRPGDDMTEAESEIRALLRQRHRLKPDQEDDFWVRNLSEV